METILEHPAGLLVQPDGGGNGTGVLVLAGSSGRVDSERAHLLARHGATAIPIRWFGDEGQPPGICEVPIETFTAALDRLGVGYGRLAVLGVSKAARGSLAASRSGPAR